MSPNEAEKEAASLLTCRKSTPCLWDFLYKDIWFVILSFFSGKESLQLGSINWRFYHLVWDEQCWKYRFEKPGDFGWKLLRESQNASSGHYDYLLSARNKVETPFGVDFSRLHQIKALRSFTSLQQSCPPNFLQKHFNTLESIELKLKDQSPADCFTRPYPALKVIYLDCYDVLTETNLQPIATMCPALQSLTMRGVCQFTRQTLDTLLALPHLKLLIFGGSVDLFTPSFFQHPLFSRITKLGLSGRQVAEESHRVYSILSHQLFSQLRTLCLWGFNYTSDALAKLPPGGMKQLHKLRLYGVDDGDWPSAGRPNPDVVTESAWLKILAWAPNLGIIDLFQVNPGVWGKNAVVPLVERGEPLTIKISAITASEMPTVQLWIQQFETECGKAGVSFIRRYHIREWQGADSSDLAFEVFT